MIINYSFWNNTNILDNKLEINTEFAKKKLLNEKK